MLIQPSLTIKRPRERERERKRKTHTLEDEVAHIINESCIEQSLIIDLRISNSLAEKVLQGLDVLNEH